MEPGVSHHEPSEPKPPHLGFDDLLRRLGRIQPGLSFGPDARAVRLLVDAVRRQVPELDPLQRRQVAEALRDVWDNEILRWVRTDVVRVVGLLGAEAAMLVPQLTDDLEEAEATWQRDLTEGGETSRPGDIVALQVEYGAKFDRTIVNRLSLTDALGAIGPAAKEAVPLLERLVVEGDPTLRYLAARALRRIHAD